MKSTKDICAIPFVIMKDNWSYNLRPGRNTIYLQLRVEFATKGYIVIAIQLRNARIARFFEEIKHVYEKLKNHSMENTLFNSCSNDNSI